MTDAGAGAFMAFFSENAKILDMASVHNELLLGKKLLQGYDCTFLKSFATRFQLQISL